MQIVYRKVTTVAVTTKTNSGQVVNLIANDSQFIADTLQNFIIGIVAPFQLIGTLLPFLSFLLFLIILCNSYCWLAVATCGLLCIARFGSSYFDFPVFHGSWKTIWQISSSHSTRKRQEIETHQRAHQRHSNCQVLCLGTAFLQEHYEQPRN